MKKQLFFLFSSWAEYTWCRIWVHPASISCMGQDPPCARKKKVGLSPRTPKPSGRITSSRREAPLYHWRRDGLLVTSGLFRWEVAGSSPRGPFLPKFGVGPTVSRVRCGSNMSRGMGAGPTCHAVWVRAPACHGVRVRAPHVRRSGCGPHMSG